MPSSEDNYIAILNPNKLSNRERLVFDRYPHLILAVYKVGVGDPLSDVEKHYMNLYFEGPWRAFFELEEEGREMAR